MITQIIALLSWPIFIGIVLVCIIKVINKLDNKINTL